VGKPFTCFCGTKTRNPYLVNGELMCVICADRVAPRLVSAKTARDWQSFVASNHHVPMSYRPRWRDQEDDD